jgi:hypothetical protein
MPSLRPPACRKVQLDINWDTRSFMLRHRMEPLTLVRSLT